MKNTFKILSLASVAVMALSAGAMAQTPKEIGDASNDPAVTATSVTKTVTVAPAATSIMMYDLNGDGMLSQDEIGNKLFYMFDTDGNESLDNIEWNKTVKITMAPFEKITVTKMDVDGDGVDEEEAINVDVFMKATGLERFDQNGEGISPRTFTGKSVLQMDTDKSGLIEMKEWKKAYSESRAPLAADNAIYNNGK